jgi:hypothetical protein
MFADNVADALINAEILFSILVIVSLVTTTAPTDASLSTQT